jgi:hypothetical protein
MSAPNTWLIVLASLVLPSVPPAAPETPSPPHVSVRHWERKSGDWCVSETSHFRIYHDGSFDLAERVGVAAEQTRTAAQERWFGEQAPDWEGPCRVFLHATSAAFARETGKATELPGYSSFRVESGRVVGRRIDLRCDYGSMLSSVLPHEVTHTVVAGAAGERPLPAWAAEGMAVLSEPRDRVQRHLRDLPRYREDGSLWSLDEFVEMDGYPSPRYLGAYYAQSVSLVDFLLDRKGPRVFVQFLCHSRTHGYGPALKADYGWTFAELEEQWRKQTFPAGR